MLCRFLCRDGESLNKGRPLSELPRGKASAGNGARLDVATSNAPTAKKPAKPAAGAVFCHFMCRDGAPLNKKRPLSELPRGKASAGNGARLDVATSNAPTAKKPAKPAAGAVFCHFMCRDGAPLNKKRPLYKLPRGKASAGNGAGTDAVSGNTPTAKMPAQPVAGAAFCRSLRREGRASTQKASALSAATGQSVRMQGHQASC